MPKIVILGSCRFEPYEVLAVPEKNPLWNTEEGYKLSTQKFYPAIDKADLIIVYAPDGVGEHTQRDIEYAITKNKPVFIIPPLEIEAPNKIREIIRTELSLAYARASKKIRELKEDSEDA